MRKFLVFLLFFGIVIGVSAFPLQIPVQVREKNISTNVFLNESKIVTIKLYDVSVGGTSLWGENKNVDFNNGYANFFLGDTNTLTNSLLDGNRWLGITIFGDFAERTPRVLLGFYPYSFFSQHLIDENQSGRFNFSVVANPPWVTSAGADSNWQNSWGIFDANLSNYYARILDVNTWFAKISDINGTYQRKVDMNAQYYSQLDANNVFLKISDSNETARTLAITIKDWNSVGVSKISNLYDWNTTASTKIGVLADANNTAWLKAITIADWNTTAALKSLMIKDWNTTASLLSITIKDWNSIGVSKISNLFDWNSTSSTKISTLADLNSNFLSIRLPATAIGDVNVSSKTNTGVSIKSDSNRICFPANTCEMYLDYNGSATIIGG